MASDKKKEFKYHKILALDGCDIFRQMHAVNGIAPLTVLKDGKLDTSRFEGVLDESLETEKLAAVYKKHAANTVPGAPLARCFAPTKTAKVPHHHGRVIHPLHETPAGSFPPP